MQFTFEVVMVSGRDKGVLFRVRRSDSLAQTESGPAHLGLEDRWLDRGHRVRRRKAIDHFVFFVSQKPDYCEFAHLVPVFSETLPLTLQLSIGAEKSSCFTPKFPISSFSPCDLCFGSFQNTQSVTGLGDSSSSDGR